MSAPSTQSLPSTSSPPPMLTSPDAVRLVVWTPPYKELGPPTVKGPETERDSRERAAAPAEPEKTMGPAKTAVPEMTTLEASTMPPDRSLSPATTSAGAESVAPRPLATASST